MGYTCHSFTTFRLNNLSIEMLCQVRWWIPLCFAAMFRGSPICLYLNKLYSKQFGTWRYGANYFASAIQVVHFGQTSHKEFLKLGELMLAYFLMKIWQREIPSVLNPALSSLTKAAEFTWCFSPFHKQHCATSPWQIPGTTNTRPFK